MGECEAEQFNEVTPSVWQCITDMVEKEFGLEITEHAGTIEKQGFTLAYGYDEAARVARVHCTDHPFFIPCSAINRHIRDLAEKCL